MRQVKKSRYNYFYQKIIKRVLSGVLSTIIPFSFVGCPKEDKEVFDDTSVYSNNILDENIKYISDVNFFSNRISSYEYSDEELNDVINEIKKLKYISSNKEFNSYDIYDMPTKEMMHILNNYKFDNNKLFTKKITDNDKKDNEFLVSITKILPEVTNDTINTLKNKFPFYQITYENINSLKLDLDEDDSYVAFYLNSSNTIFLNLNKINDMSFLKQTLSHELTHLLLNKTNNENLVLSGSSIDDLTTYDSPLELKFIEEYLAEEIARITYNPNSNNYYVEEYEKLLFLSLSTGKNINDILNCFIGGNQNDFIDLFEMELRDFNYVYSNLCALNISCGYGYFKSDNDDINYYLRGEFNNYAKVNLIKNAYVRLLKKYKNNLIDKDEYYEEINNIKDNFINSEFNYWHDNLYLEDIFNSLDDICNSYINKKGFNIN